LTILYKDTISLVRVAMGGRHKSSSNRRQSMVMRGERNATIGRARLGAGNDWARVRLGAGNDWARVRLGAGTIGRW
jgi:hypothetical protein